MIALPSPITSNRVCSPRELITCHPRRRLIVYVVQGWRWMPCSTMFDYVYAFRGRWWCVMPDIVWTCVIHNGHNGMPRLTSFHSVCYQRAVMECYTQCHLTTCFAKWRWWHATHDVIQPFVLPKGNVDIPRSTSTDSIYYQREMITCHARRRPIVYAFIARW